MKIQELAAVCAARCAGKTVHERTDLIAETLQSLLSASKPAATQELPQAVLDALRFYAHGHHYNIDDDHQQFDTVSGEPQNWLFSERDDDCTMIEDGSIAKAVLLGGLPGFEEPAEPIEGEVFTAAPTFDLSQEFVTRASEDADAPSVIGNTIPAAPAQSGEPVASARIGTVDVIAGRVRSYTFEQTDTPDGSYSLYTAPQPPQSAEGGEACSPYKCQAAQQDGVLCADDSCDIATGARTTAVVLDDERAPLHGLSRHQCNAIEYFVMQMRDTTSAEYVDMLDAFRDYINSLVRAASPAAPAQSGEPIYERYTVDGGWIKTSRLGYESQPENSRRILYAAPQPSPTAGVLDDERAAFGEAFRRNFTYPNDSEVHTFRKGWEAGIMYARAASPQPVAQPVEQTRALTMDEGELDEFDRTVTDFEDDGETSTDYNLLMSWAQRGFLECTHFEVTKAGQDLLTVARPASGETE